MKSPQDNLRHSTAMRYVLGFTLVELMVTVSVLGILIALAAPSFQSLIERVRVESKINALRNDLSYTRSEAMRTGQTMDICRSRNDGTTQCATDGTTGWENGWFVYFDANGNNKIDNGESPIRAGDPFLNGITAQNAQGNYMKQRVQFSAQGVPSGGLSTGCINFCPASGCITSNPNGRYLTLNRVGRTRIFTETDAYTPQNIDACSAP